VFPIHVPPLRERRDDIPLLVRHFARHYAAHMGRRVQWISTSAMDALVAYPWPGNIRQLQNVIQRAVIRPAHDWLDVPLHELAGRASVSHIQSGPLADAERAHILATLKDTQWVLAGPRGAARRLGINRGTLQFRMKKLGIERPTAS